MLIVHISPGGVKEVQFHAPSEFFEDLDLAVWPLVRKELARLDKKLKRAAKNAMEMAEEESFSVAPPGGAPSSINGVAQRPPRRVEAD